MSLRAADSRLIRCGALTLCVSALAHAQPVRMTRTSIDQYTPIEAIYTSFDNAQLRQREWSARGGRSDCKKLTTGPCWSIDLQRWRAIGAPAPGAGVLLGPPYPADVEPVDFEYTSLEQLPKDGALFRKTVAWVPESQVSNGRALTETWQKEADSGEHTECDPRGCHIIVYAVPRGRWTAATLNPNAPTTKPRPASRPDSEPPIADVRDTLLARCYAERISGELGVPEDCVHIATFAEKRWVRVTLGYYGNGSRSSPAIAGPEPRSPDLRLVDARSVTLPRVIAAVEAALRAPPLALETDIVGNVVRGLSKPKYRVSSVLHPPPTWREFVQTHVVATETGSGASHAVSVTLDVSVNVNRQNTTGAEDWHLPTDQQLDAYRAAIEDQLVKAMSALCGTASVVDSHTRRCTS